jgi:hypothetical protein
MSDARIETSKTVAQDVSSRVFKKLRVKSISNKVLWKCVVLRLFFTKGMHVVCVV